VTPSPEPRRPPASQRRPRPTPPLVSPRRCARARRTRRLCSAWRWSSATRSRASCPVQSLTGITSSFPSSRWSACTVMCSTVGSGPHQAITQRWSTWWNLSGPSGTSPSRPRRISSAVVPSGGEVFQAGADLGSAQRRQGGALQLAGALAGYAQHRPNFLQRPWGAGVQPKPQDQHPAAGSGQARPSLSSCLSLTASMAHPPPVVGVPPASTLGTAAGEGITKRATAGEPQAPGSAWRSTNGVPGGDGAGLRQQPQLPRPGDRLGAVGHLQLVE
jgi:hypothetical protein